MDSPFELLAICVDNKGEVEGLPVANFLKKNECYSLRGLSGGYGGESIAYVYDKNGKIIQVGNKVGEEGLFWNATRRFVLSCISNPICLN